MDVKSEILHRLNFDLKAEALAAFLMDCAPAEFSSITQFLVAPRGHLTRKGGREVQDARLGEVWNDDERVLQLHLSINREGLFDILPASLFLHPDDPCEDDAEKAELLTKQSEAGRRFLLPFDQVMYQALIEVERHEQQRIQFPEAFLDRVLGQNDSDADSATLAKNRQRLVMVSPLLDQIVLKPDLKQKVLAFVLDNPVTIEVQPPKPIDIPVHLQSKLGEDCSVGTNFVLGSSFMDGVPHTELTVYLDGNDNLETWLPGGGHARFLDNAVVPMFFAADAPLSTKIDIHIEKRDFTLNAEQPTAALGYSTYL